MKRLAAVCLASAAAGCIAAPIASADSSSPPNCYGQEIAAGATSSTALIGEPGLIGLLASGYVHCENSLGLNLGQAGIPEAKAPCPALPPPPPTL